MMYLQIEENNLRYLVPASEIETIAALTEQSLSPVANCQVVHKGGIRSLYKLSDLFEQDPSASYRGSRLLHLRTITATVQVQLLLGIIEHAYLKIGTRLAISNVAYSVISLSSLIKSHIK